MVKVKKFEVGDIVQIAETSEYYGIDRWNPMNVPGRVDEAGEGDLSIIVCWDNDTENSYNEEDLQLSNLRR